MLSPLAFAASALLLGSAARAFSFSIGTPTQCGDLTVEFSQGTGPYRFIVVPTGEGNYHQLLNISIPASQTSPYTLSRFAEPAGLQFIATMYDEGAGGYAASGVTELLTVGSSSSNDDSCLNRNPTADFYFYLSATNPTQCQSYTFGFPNNYTAPAYVIGMIPNGNYFTAGEITSGGQTSWTWDKADIKAGTRVLFAMSDGGSTGTGGSSGILTVQGSGDSSCLNAQSPMSITTSSTSTTATATSSGSGAASSSAIAGVGGGGGGSGQSNAGTGSSSSSSSSLGAIIGGVVGGVVALLILALLAFCCFRRRRQVRDPHHPRSKLIGSYGLVGSGDSRSSSEKESRRSGGAHSHNADLLGGVGAARTTNGVSPGYTEEQMYEPSPFFAAAAPAGTGTTTSGSHSRNQSSANDSISQEKAGTPGAFAANPSRTSDSTNSYGFEWNPAIWGTTSGSRPASLASETHAPYGSASSVGGATAGHPAPPSAYHGSGAEAAVAGASIGRSASTRKAPISAPTTPQAASRGHFESVGPDHGLQSTGTGPDSTGRPTRFVLHEDGGAMEETLSNEEPIELPPRYDQVGAKQA